MQILNVIKTSKGWVEVGNRDNKSATHKIIYREDFQNIIDKYNKKVEQNMLLENSLKKNIEKIKERENEIFELTNRINTIKIDLEHQKNMNVNLLRINKERSNQERNIQPKKEHTGYVIIQSNEKNITHGKRKTNCWETLIESPYTVDLNDSIVRKQIFDDLSITDNHCLLNKIGIDKLCLFDNNDDIDYLDEEDMNILFKLNLKANFKTNLWEIIIFHSKALDVIPKDMRINR